MKRRLIFFLLALAVCCFSAFAACSEDGTISGNHDNTEESDDTEPGGTEEPDDTEEPGGTEGNIELKLAEDGGSYIVEGPGTFTGDRLLIPETSNGLSVTAIADNAFAGCDNIERVTIPESISEIGARAFADCMSLYEVTFNATQANDLGRGEDVFVSEGGCSLSVSIGAAVTRVPAHLFQNAYVTDVTFEDGSLCTEIGDEAFSLCRFRTIDLPDSVAAIGDGAFNACRSMKSIALPQHLDSFGVAVFLQCSSLRDVTLPENLAEIPAATFLYCELLERIKIPQGVTKIGSSAFAGCFLLEQITLPARVTEIGASAFSGCCSLKNIALPEHLGKIEMYTFNNCSALESIIIHARVNEIAEGAFSGCSSLALVYYSGTEEQWADIATDAAYNTYLSDATVIYDHGK